MEVVALADFGSTFTKVTVVEEGSGRLLGQGHHPTTVQSDVMTGYDIALERAVSTIGQRIDVVAEIAASSAAGGLRMATAGLVDELTAAAGRQAALNAGAKVELVLAGDLDDASCERLAATAPEILMFCGGTDGGQTTKVIANARALAAAEPLRFVVVACNAHIAHEVAAIFHRPGRTVQVVDNVLPQIDRLDIESARSTIHELFIRHVIGGKGLSSDPRFERLVTMPTPEAVLEAVRLLAFGAHSDQRTAGVLVVDIGG
ncbi:MAG: glutamate mutase L, partial [Actinobacteria bacterium]|nr:glutamate mutase L [Actinomycetota bacterium]